MPGRDQAEALRHRDHRDVPAVGEPKRGGEVAEDEVGPQLLQEIEPGPRRLLERCLVMVAERVEHVGEGPLWPLGRPADSGRREAGRLQHRGFGAERGQHARRSERRMGHDDREAMGRQRPGRRKQAVDVP